MTSAALAGSTGLVVRHISLRPSNAHLANLTKGSHILSQLLSHPSITSVHAYARRELPNPTNSTKLHALSSTDTSTWTSLFPTNPAPRIFFSGLGTTRAAAGGVEAQRKIDLDLNYDLARAAKSAGCTTYVLISSASASSSSMVLYSKMKGELEDKVKELGFKHTVILRPGLIGGKREESRPAEAVMRALAGGLRGFVPGFVDLWSQDADVIARAAINAGLECEGGGRKEGVWELGRNEIVSLGKEKK
jgi:hypothetical protein